MTRKDEAEPGFMGLTVVPARLKDTTTEIHMAAPMRARPTEERRYAGNIKSKEGAADEAHHISAATIKQTATEVLTSGSARTRNLMRRSQAAREQETPVSATSVPRSAKGPNFEPLGRERRGPCVLLTCKIFQRGSISKPGDPSSHNILTGTPRPPNPDGKS